MVTFRNFISALFGLFLLTKCNTKEGSSYKTLAPSTSIATQHKNSLIGEWNYNFPFYSSELILHNDRTFAFHDQGCYGQRFTQGQWTDLSGSVFLTSFDTFKPKEETEPINIVEVTEPQETKPRLKKNEVEYWFVGLKDIPAPAMMGPNDTVRIYLDKVQLQLRNDTLFSVGSNKLSEEAKFYRTNDYR
jgi:hypothetical protein